MTASASEHLCPKERCYAPQVACLMGDDLADCSVFAAAEREPDRSDPIAGASALPWSGLGLGSDDVATIAAIGRPAVLGLVGPASAGKTTTLASLFTDLRRGATLAAGRFAGSFTLLGWQIVSSFVQWPPYGRGGFPPHTTAADVRSPCLLHLRLRDDARGGVRELLLSDMPGEWFTDWAVDANDGVGASWLAEHANAFVLFADCEALASAQRGRARADYEALARRLHTVVGARPVIPVLAKGDVKIPAAIQTHIARVNRSLFDAKTHPISARDRRLAATSVLDRAATLALGVPPPAGDPVRRQEPLLAYRSRSVRGG
jgi:hypothetical protein